MTSEEAESFLKAWDSGQTEFYIESSGSTSAPKTIVLERQWMEWSAAQTASFIKPQKHERLYACLPINKVGGLMVLLRARVWQMPLICRASSANPLLEKIEADIVSLTPYQLQHIVDNPISFEHLMRFREVLIGGSGIHPTLEKKLQSIDASCQIRLSYGMSETYSHIAIRNINGPDRSEWFTLLDGISLKEEEDAVRIYTPYYPKGLACNDLFEFKSATEFKISGRKDFTINSGGLKFQIETLEKSIQSVLNTNEKFVISSVSDALLGEKIVLVCENKNYFEQVDFGFLKTISAYALPKAIIAIDTMPYNEGGKIDRIKIKNWINTEPIR